jgi:multidrug efflux system membrane fusion protein
VYPRHIAITPVKGFVMALLHHRYAVAIVAVALLAGGVTLFRLQTNAVAALTPPTRQAVAVDVAQVSTRSITDWREYSGRLEAVDHVQIRPLVSGTITAVHFKDGSVVRAGDVLFTIDPRPYQAAVDKARADLAAAKARVAYTGADLARARRLLAKNAIAERDFEEKRNASRVAAAEKQGAEAALASAELDLEHTQIVAPVSGRVSRAEVTEGNIVGAGTAAPPLTTLVSIDKMYASFEVDEQSFLSFVNPARKGQGQQTSVSLGLSNERGFPRQGEVASIDNRLDTSSGTIRVRAIFDNADGMLVPGLYARIRLGGGAPRAAVLIDETAIGTDQDKRFVVVVDEQNRTAYREVQLGALQEGLRVVEAGLAPGERIVVNGLQRIRPGDPVEPKAVVAEGKDRLADGKGRLADASGVDRGQPVTDKNAAS